MSASSVLAAARATLADEEPRSRGSRSRTPSSSARCCVAMLLCAEAMLPSARHACVVRVGVRVRVGPGSGSVLRG